MFPFQRCLILLNQDCLHENLMANILKGSDPNENILNHDKAIQSLGKGAPYCI